MFNEDDDDDDDDDNNNNNNNIFSQDKTKKTHTIYGAVNPKVKIQVKILAEEGKWTRVD